MRIGIMLRAYEESGGIGVYTNNVVRELLAIDAKNRYVLFHQNPGSLGAFQGYPNVTERLVRGDNKFIWDQVKIPLACRRENLDVIFHPKFTVPLLAPCKAVMTVHGADWFIPDQARYYHRLDVLYIRTVMPLYFRKAAAVISVSRLTTENFRHALRIPPEKIETVYFGPARHFRRVEDRSTLEEVRSRYRLPEQFILTLTKPKGDRRKNLEGVFKAYAHYHAQTDRPSKLVVGGKDCQLYRETYGIPENGYGSDILFPGWIDQCDLPAVYSLAGLYLYPSRLEAFPIPITEAMACGTPIVTSNANGLKEIAGDAAVLVDPDDPGAIAEAMLRIHRSASLREDLSKKGLERAKAFTWDRCAHRTLEILERVGGFGGPRP